VINAYWQNMRLQVDLGIRPPSMERIAKDAAGVTLRDQLGNPLGGLACRRWTDPDADMSEYRC
jgi:hypothetical protein